LGLTSKTLGLGAISLGLVLETLGLAVFGLMAIDKYFIAPYLWFL
jgi:hypothetical protein